MTKRIQKFYNFKMADSRHICDNRLEYSLPGKGTTDAIFTVRQMQEKYGCKGKKLYFAFVDLKKI